MPDSTVQVHSAPRNPSGPPPSKRAKTQHATSSNPHNANASAIDTLFAKNPDISVPVRATRGPKTAADLAPPPEIVQNVQGSSAGAGSGEFHVYKAARRKEFERLRLMDEDAKREEKNKEWAAKRAENARKDEEKRSKSRKKREKAKERKGKAQNGKREREDSEVPSHAENTEQDDEAGADSGRGDDNKKLASTAGRTRLQPRALRRDEDGEDEEVSNEAPQASGIAFHDDD